MKVLHVLASNRFFGAENVVCQIINLFKNDKNIEMAYCSPLGPIYDILNEKKIKYYGIDCLNIKNIKKIINEYKPDIIHTHDMKASVIVACSSKTIPIISHIHNNSYSNRMISLKSVIYRLFKNRFSQFIWVSYAALNNYVFKRSIRSKSSVLYNTVDYEFIKKQVNMDKNIYDYDLLYLGRLEYPKNPMKFLRISKNLIKKNKNLKIGVAGEGSYKAKISKKIKKANLNNNIDMLGYVENPYKMLSDAKLLVITSRWEGMPIVALEAMVLNTPIVCTGINELVELVGKYHLGFICKNNKEFQKRILQILKNTNTEIDNTDNKKVNDKNDIETLKNNVLKLYNKISN